METILANVAAQIAVAEEAAIKRDLNKAVGALLEAVRSLCDGATLLSTATVTDAPKKAPARKPAAKKAPAKAQATTERAAASKRTAPVIKPK
jgi:hypothetical protein